MSKRTAYYIIGLLALILIVYIAMIRSSVPAQQTMPTVSLSPTTSPSVTSPVSTNTTPSPTP